MPSAVGGLPRALDFARLALAFGRVERATLDEFGGQAESDTDHTVMLALMVADLAELPSLQDRVDVGAYERQDSLEARLVRFVDKVLPKLTHVLNAGAALEERMLSPADVRGAHVAQLRELVEANPDLPEVETLFTEAHHAAVDAYAKRIAPHF